MEQVHQLLVQINVRREHIVPQEVQVVQIVLPVLIVQKVLQVVQIVQPVHIVLLVQQVVLHVEPESGALQKVQHVVT